jgi:hypothetical protein
MNKLVVAVAFSFISIVCTAQNLVPNGSFETYSGCPTTGSQIDSTINWFSANPGTPDYFNSCSSSTLVGVPVNWNLHGYQKPNSGEAYVGIYTCQFANSQKELIETRLTAPLTAGRTYHLNMYVNLMNYCRYTTHNIGAYFSDTLIIMPTYLGPPVPQIVNPVSNKFDTLAWTLVSGDYTAHGGEEYIILGNFDSDVLTDTTYYQNAPYYGLYLYIDDVSVADIAAGIENIHEQQAAVYYNDIDKVLHVETGKNEDAVITVYDVAGRINLQRELTGSSSIPVAGLTPGIYIYKLSEKDGTTIKGKIVKQ